jgi:hypothetical protein
VKTTLEIPDAVFRRAKSKAAEQGMPFRQLVTEGVEDKLKATIAGDPAAVSGRRGTQSKWLFLNYQISVSTKIFSLSLLLT